MTGANKRPGTLPITAPNPNAATPDADYQAMIHARDCARRTRRDPWHVWFVGAILRPGDLRFLIFRAYVAATEFLGAHAGGFVSRETAHDRLSRCRECLFGARDGASTWCKLPAGLGCSGCPKWRPNRLEWRVRLRRVDCPIGKWPTAKKKS